MHIQSDNQIAPTSRWTFNGTGGWQEIELLGHNVTSGGLTNSNTDAAVENTWGETGYGSATLTINTAAGSSFSYYGTIRDTW